MRSSDYLSITVDRLDNYAAMFLFGTDRPPTQLNGRWHLSEPTPGGIDGKTMFVYMSQPSGARAYLTEATVEGLVRLGGATYCEVPTPEAT